MLTLTYQEEIKAPLKKVWDTIWNQETYRAWTKPFNENSQIDSDWKVGGKTLFTDGMGNGMVSTLRKWNPPYEAEFEHLGELKNGTESIFSKEHPYSGAIEKYSLFETPEGTKLVSSLQTVEEYKSSMDEIFPTALRELKKICES